MARCSCLSTSCACTIEVMNDANSCVNLTISGSGNNSADDPYIISADTVIDPATSSCLNCGVNGLRLIINPDTTNNLLTCSGTGLLADLVTTNSATVAFTGQGTTVSPLNATVPVGSVGIIVNDTASVDFTGNGTTATPLSATVEDLAVFSRSGVATVSTGVSRFKFPYPATLINVTAAVNTAPTGADIILDVNLNGVTIFTTQANRPRVLAGTFQETVDAVPNITAVANDQYLTVDIDQIGSTIAGSDLTVFVRYRRA